MQHSITNVEQLSVAGLRIQVLAVCVTSFEIGLWSHTISVYTRTYRHKHSTKIFYRSTLILSCNIGRGEAYNWRPFEHFYRTAPHCTINRSIPALGRSLDPLQESSNAYFAIEYAVNVVCRPNHRQCTLLPFCRSHTSNVNETYERMSNRTNEEKINTQFNEKWNFAPQEILKNIKYINVSKCAKCKYGDVDDEKKWNSVISNASV